MMSLELAAARAERGGRCRSCGCYVSHSFARVFGDNDNEIYGCPNCTTFRGLSEGEASGRDGSSWSPV